MNKIELYSKILSVRTKLKRLQQVSWNINQLEKKYQLDDLEDDEMEYLLSAYLSYIDELEITLNELKDEQKPRVDKNP